MARRTRPQDHQLGWNFRKRSFADSHCYVVAQFEKRYRRDRNRQSCHHGTKWFLLPELLSDERSDEHRRIRFGQQIMHSALTTDLHWRNVLIFSVSRRTFDEYIFTSTHLKHIQLSRLPSFAKVSWSYGPQGLYGFQAPHEHLSQMLQYRRLQLHHLFLRRPGRIKPNGR